MAKETILLRGKKQHIRYEKKLSVVSASLAIDTIINLPGNFRDFAQPDSTHFFGVSLLVDKLKKSFGGVAANIAYTQALLGAEPRLLASIGEQDKHELVRLHSAGVNLDHVHYSETPTASFFVLSDQEHSQIAAFHIGAMGDSKELNFEHWKNKNALMIVGAHDPQQMHQQILQCKEYGLKLAFIVGQQVNNVDAELLKDGIDVSQIMILNDNEVNVLAKKTGKTIDEIKAQVPIFITTLGKEGSDIEGKALGHGFHIPAVMTENVVDSTGCGDAYAAGFLYGVQQGLSLFTAGRIGALAATYVLEQHGTLGHSYTPDEFKQRYLETYGEALSLYRKVTIRPKKLRQRMGI